MAVPSLFNVRYGELISEIIGTTYAQDSAKLNEVIKGQLFKEVLSECLGFEVASFYFYDEELGSLMFFEDAVPNGIVMPFYRIVGEKEDGMYVSIKVEDKEFERRRLKQRASLKREGEPLTAMLCYDNLVSVSHRWSKSEGKNNWILIPEGEIVVFSFEYMLRRRLTRDGYSTKSAALRALETISIAEDAWSSMHTDEAFKWMRGRESASLKKAAGWLNEVLSNDDDYEYLWRCEPSQRNWFIECRAEVLRLLQASPEDSGHFIRRLAELIVRHSYPLEGDASIDIKGTQFYKRSRVSPTLELLHGTHNIVMFLIRFHLPVVSVPTDEPLKVFLLGTFYDKERCVDHREEIRNIYSLAMTRDLFRYSMSKLAGVQKTVRRAEQIVSAFSGQEFIHELKNPIRLIKANIERVQRELSRKDKRPLAIEEILAKMKAKANDAEVLVDGMRSIAQQALITKKTHICLARKMPELVTTLVEDHTVSVPKAVELEFHCQDKDTFVYINEMSLGLIMKNLLNNAIEAMGGAGTISIKCWRDKDFVRLAVADTGPGIKEELLPILFKPFSSTKRDAGGLGLGLYLCKNIVELQGGTIAAKNLEDGGASFTVSFKASVNQEV